MDPLDTALRVQQAAPGILESLCGTLTLFGDAFAATLLLAAALAFLGVHVILRRVVFVGVALAQLASLGIAASFFAERFPATDPPKPLSFLREHWFMAALADLTGLAFLIPGERRNLSREARIAVCFAVSGALAVILVLGSPHGMDELKALMTGDPLFVSHQDLTILVAILVPSILTLVVFFRRFLLVAFDRDAALSLGIHAARWDVVFFVLLGVSLALAIHMAGILFALGFLVLPAAAALSFARHPWSIFGGSAAIGVGSAAVGFFASHELDWPLGPTAVVVAACGFAAVRIAVRFRT